MQVQSSLTFLVLLAPVAFLLAASAAISQPGINPRRVQRLGSLAAFAGVAISVGAVIALVTNGTTVSPTLGAEGLGLSVRLDPLSVTMLVMIALLAVVIVRYSNTYLDGDARHGTFLGRLLVTFAGVELLVLAGNLAVLVVAWIATSLALHQLLTFYRDRRGAVIAARKKLIAARLGDGFLIAAAALLYHHFGTGDLGEIFTGARDAASVNWSLGSVQIAAAFLAIAAMLKSAQFPTHGWLVEVMETPTPVSALLHAGILNAGPFLAIRMSWVLDDSRFATSMLVVVGGFTAIFASVVLLTQPSVKVALGYSSAAHMGFSLMLCGMGIYPAALLHLVAHSFYKAHAFLSSGSAIDEARAAHVRLPRRTGKPVRVAASVGIAVALYALLAVAFGVDVLANPALLLIGAILVMGTAQLVAATLDSDGERAVVARVVAMALGVTIAFFALEGAADALLGEAVPHNGSRDAIQLSLMALMVAAFGAVVLLQIVDPARTPSARRRALAVHVRNGFYANAAFDRLVHALRVRPTTTTTTTLAGETA